MKKQHEDEQQKKSLRRYYLWKKLSKFFHAFSFQICSTVNSKFYFSVSLFEINCIKIQAISVVYNPINFTRDSLCFIYFDVIIRQRLKTSLSQLIFFFSRANEIKTCGLVKQLIQTCSEILSYNRAAFIHLMEIRL